MVDRIQITRSKSQLRRHDMRELGWSVVLKERIADISVKGERRWERGMDIPLGWCGQTSGRQESIS
jgi:hypothetical protein